MDVYKLVDMKSATQSN